MIETIALAYGTAALPIAQHRERIIEALHTHAAMVLAGETGSGKSTQLPRYCLEAGRGERGRIAHTQPRRLAARALAARIAAERGETVGNSVGYRVRFADEVSERSRLVLMTDGLLLTEVARDPYLRAYDTLIIDEAHERSLNIDLLLGVAKRILARRPEFRLIVASATLDVERVAQFLGNAPIIDVGGRLHPIETRYRPPQPDENGEEPDLPAAVAESCRELLANPGEGGEGDILVFLPGEREIRDVGETLEREFASTLDILPLYSRLAWEEQRRIFDPRGRRRTILATNVAETSITVPRVRFVIDSGLARISRYSPASRMQRLPIEPVPRAGCEQRKGRCGRIGPGVCIRLFSQQDFDARPEHAEPEVLRTNLSALLLRLAADELGSAEEFPFLDSPDRRSLNDGYRTLLELGALDEEHRITDRGRAMARLPVDPRLARAILESRRFRAAAEVLAIAAGLSVPDPQIPLPRGAPAPPSEEEFEQASAGGDTRSEFSAMVRRWQAYRAARRRPRRELRQWCKGKRLSLMRLSEWEDVYLQLADRARELGIVEQSRPASYAAVHRSLLAGFCSHIGLHEERGLYAGVRGTHFRIFPGSALKKRQPRWILAANIVETSQVFARTVAQIEPSWIEPAARHLIRREYYAADWDEAREQVIARERVNLLGLTLAASRLVNYGPVAPEEARHIFVREAIVFRRMERRPAWLRQNDAALDAVQQLEERLRTRDLQAAPETLVRFYDHILPRQVSSADALEAWTRHCTPRQLEALRLDEDTLYTRRPDPASLAMFPQSVLIRAQSFPVSYRFEPDSEDDGASILIPLEVVPLLDGEELARAIPGLTQPRIEAWMRNLPKSARRELIPIADAAQAFLAAGAAQPRPNLPRWLNSTRGIELADIEAARHGLPRHLLPRLVILDGDHVVAQGRNWGELARHVSGPAAAALERHVRVRYPAPWQRFADDGLPHRRDIALRSGNIEIHLGLRDLGNAAQVAPYYTEGEAEHAHRHGIVRLARLELSSLSKEMARVLSRDTPLQLAASAHARSAELEDALLCQAFAQSLSPQSALPRTRAEFDALLLSCRNHAFENFQRLCELWRGWYGEANALRQLIAGSPARETLKSEAQAHMRELLHPPRWQWQEPRRLQQLPRHLKAAGLRWRRLAVRPAENPAVLNEMIRWREQARQMRAAFIQVRRWTEELEHFEWLVEEYRCSLSAQELGTTEPVSEPRLRARLA
ncbi:MAG: ATP-dependent RNA helicase HrpA, partial [Proteobacteria bacterium]|nr:ATP-dependent RNA helicase HrpA [Pseudomonadota bacterium]